MANSAPATHFNASKHFSISSEGTSPLFLWQAFYAGVSWTVVSSEVLAKQIKDQGPFTPGTQGAGRAY